MASPSHRYSSTFPNRERARLAEGRMLRLALDFLRPLTGVFPMSYDFCKTGNRTVYTLRRLGGRIGASFRAPYNQV